MLSVFLSTAASVAGVSRAWPQLAKIVVHRDATGVSSLTWILSLSCTLVWEVMGIGLDILPTIIFNIALATGQAAVLIVLVRQGHLAAWKPIAACLVATSVAVATLALFGRTGISILAFAMATYMFLPQALKVARQPAYGVSMMSWVLATLSGTFWSAYGLVIGEFVLVAPGLITIPVAAYISWRAWLASRSPSITQASPSPGDDDAAGMPIA